jgi:hypothetical protein
MRKIHLDKFPERPLVRKASLMFVEDNKICDGCDVYRVKCASIRTLNDGISILCQDCIEGILESLDQSVVRDIKINKVLNDN